MNQYLPEDMYKNINSRTKKKKIETTEMSINCRTGR